MKRTKGLAGLILGLGIAVVPRANATQDRVETVLPGVTGNVVVGPIWQPQYKIQAIASGNGSVSGPTNVWFDEGTLEQFRAVPSRYHRFSGWSGDISGGATDNHYITVPIDRARDIVANFAQSATSNGVPHEWLARHGIADDFDAAELHDPDGDGYRTWEEYIAGTDPTNSGSYFPPPEVSRAGDAVTLRIPRTVAGRVYHIDRTPALVDPAWVNITNKPGTGGEWSVQHTPTNNPDFYRAGVRKP